MKNQHKSVLQFLQKILFLAIFFSGYLHATTYFIHPQGLDENDGLSWQTAKKSLQQTINSVNTGDQIWIAQGTYTPQSPRIIESSTGCAYSFILKNGVSLYGGFAGTETSLDERPMEDLSQNGLIESWEFSCATILSGQTDYPGSVVIGDTNIFTIPVTLDGLTLQNGKADGQNNNSYGGGARLTDNTILRNCQIIHNSARIGAGLYIHGAVTIDHCYISENTLLNDCWNSKGGGIFITGDNAKVLYSILLNNGTAILGGGGIYNDGNNIIDHCVLAKNTSVSYGSGIRFSDCAALMQNSILWKNTPENTQIVPNNATLTQNACTQFISKDNICLDPENSKSDELQKNNNNYEKYYACLTNPTINNYSLSTGSYLINRAIAIEEQESIIDACDQNSCRYGHPDIGAYESNCPGNLTIDFYLDNPLYYNSNTEIYALTTDNTTAVCSLENTGQYPNGGTSEPKSENYLGLVEGNTAGEMQLQANIQQTSGEESYWNQNSTQKQYDVLSRTLVLQGAEQTWTNGPFPELEWCITRGNLASGDKLEGQAQLLGKATQSGIYSFGIGSLCISPKSAQKNYDIKFLPGTLDCQGGTAQISWNKTQYTYTSNKLQPNIKTVPADLDLFFSYIGSNGTDYSASATPPTNCGTYLVTTTIQNSYCTGDNTTEITITPAVLTCTAENKEKLYTAPLPEFTIRYSGLCRNDSTAIITPPKITTEATKNSIPKEAGYCINLEGGSAPNYTLKLVPGKLTVQKVAPLINEAIAGICTYGTPMKYILLMAYATNPLDDSYVSGEFIWDTPDFISPAGDWEYPWTFIPSDASSFSEIRGTTSIYVAPRKIEIAALPQEKIYGESDPKLTYEITTGSMTQEDPLSLTLSRTPGEDPDDYTITLENMEKNKNYDVTFQQNFLTIHKRAITIQAVNNSKDYLSNDPPLTYIITKGELINNDTFSGNLNRLPGENPGIYSIQQGNLCLPTPYKLDFIPAEFTIRKATLDSPDIPSALTINYGSPLNDSLLTFKVVQKETRQAIDGTLHWQQQNCYPKPGEKKYAWIFTPDQPENFLDYSGELEILTNKKTLDALFVKNYSREYQSSNPTFEYTMIGFQQEDTRDDLQILPVVTCSADKDSTPGDYSIELSAGQDECYAFHYHPATLTITPAKPKITEESPIVLEHNTGSDPNSNPTTSSALTYGEPLRQLVISGNFYNNANPPELISGTLSWKNPDLILPAGTQEQQWTFQPNSELYTSTSGWQTVQVNKAPLTISVPEYTIEADENLPDFKIQYSGFVNSDTESSLLTPVICQCEAQNSSTCGDFSIQLTDTDAANYTIHYSNNILHITPILLQASNNNTPITINYGTSLENCTPKQIVTCNNNADVPGTFTWKNPEMIPNAGTYNAEWIFSPKNNPEKYSPLTGTQLINIEPTEITITAINQTQLYGNSEKELLYEQSNNVNINAVTLTGTLEREPGKNAGTYQITQGSLACSENHTIHFAPAIYVITKKELTVIPEHVDKKYHETDPELTFSLSEPLSYNDTISGTLTRTAGEEIGEYPFSLENLIYSNNYILHLSTPSFSIHTYTLELHADFLQKSYGRTDPGLTWKCTQKELPNDVHFTGYLTREAGENTGSYSITQGSLTCSNNYLISFVPASLTINPEKINIQVSAAEKNYLEKDPDFEYTIVSGTLCSGDAISGKPSRAPGEDVGTYAMTAGTLNISQNYEISVQENNFTIIPKQIKIAIQDQSKYQGETDPEWTWSQTDYSLNMKDINADITLQRDLGETPGNYAINSIHQSCSKNYQMNILAGNLIIKPATFLAKNISTQNIHYGQPLEKSVISGNIIYTNGNIQQAGTFTWENPDKILNAGEHTQNWCFTLLDAPEQKITGETIVTVLPKSITVTALQESKIYGDEDPLLQYEVNDDDFVEDDTVITGQLERIAGEKLGAYKIGIGSLSFGDNYSIDFINNYLSIYQSIIYINHSWKDQYQPLQNFSWEGKTYTYEVNAWDNLEDAAPYCQPGGTIILAPGDYGTSQNQWVFSESLELLAESPNTVFFTQPMQFGGTNCTQLVLTNLDIVISEENNTIASALQILGGTQNVELSHLTIESLQNDALLLSGVSHFSGNQCHFSAPQGACLKIVPDYNDNFPNDNIRFTECCFNESQNRNDPQSYVELYDDINPEIHYALPIISSTFNQQTITHETSDTDILEIKENICDAKSPLPNTKTTVFLKEEIINCTFDSESEISEITHIFTMGLDEITTNPQDYTFNLTISDLDGNIKIQQVVSPDSKQEIGIDVSRLNVGNYKVSTTLLSPLKDYCYQKIAYENNTLKRMPPESIDYIEVVTDPENLENLPAGTPIQVSMTAYYQIYQWDITNDPEIKIIKRADLKKTIVDQKIYLSATKNGEYSATISYKDFEYNLNMSFTYLEESSYTQLDAKEILTMGEFYLYQFLFYDKYYNKTDDYIVKVESSDPEYCYPIHNSILIDINAPITSTTITLTSKNNHKIVLTQKLISPGYNWNFDWYIKPDITDNQQSYNVYNAANELLQYDDVHYTINYEYKDIYYYYLNDYYNLCKAYSYEKKAYFFYIDNLTFESPAVDYRYLYTPYGLETAQFITKERDNFNFPDDPIYMIANMKNDHSEFYFIKKSRFLYYRENGIEKY